jgi:hypothetical protein
METCAQTIRRLEDRHQEELAKVLRERDEARIELAVSRKTVHELRVELGLARPRLAACSVVARGGDVRAVRPECGSDSLAAVCELHELLEALRSAADKVHDELEWVRDGVYQHCAEPHCTPLLKLVDSLRKLLRPAAEPPPETCANPGCEDCHGGTQRCSLSAAARARRGHLELRDENERFLLDVLDAGSEWLRGYIDARKVGTR